MPLPKLFCRAEHRYPQHKAPGQLFLALKGENFDGHDFVGQALAAGAQAAALVRTRISNWRTRPEAKPAHGWTTPLPPWVIWPRPGGEAHPVPLVSAITGSNGKTSTKEMLASAF